MMVVRATRTALLGVLLLASSCSSLTSVPDHEPVLQVALEDEVTTPIPRGPPGSFIEIKPWEALERCDYAYRYLVEEAEFVDAWLTSDVEWYTFNRPYDNQHPQHGVIQVMDFVTAHTPS